MGDEILGLGDWVLGLHPQSASSIFSCSVACGMIAVALKRQKYESAFLHIQAVMDMKTRTALLSSLSALAFATTTALAQPSVPMTPYVSIPLVSTPVIVPPKFQGMFNNDRILNLPEGWSVKVFQGNGLFRPRFLTWGPDSVLYVADIAGRIVALPDKNPRDGVADEAIIVANEVFAHDIKFYNGALYAAEQTRVLQLTDTDGDGIYEKRSVFISGIPGGGGHVTRTIVFDSLNQKIYLSIGSSCNVCREDDRAIIEQYNINGTGRRTYATGVRNAVGMTLHPRTNQLWATNNGHDNQGNDIPPEWVDIVRENGFYGWPFAYGVQVYNDFTREGGYRDLLPITPADSTLVRTMVPPGALVQAHSALMAIEFPNTSAFPEEYSRGAFVVSRGSWNRQPAAGYKIMYLGFMNDQDTIANFVTDFLTGFLTDSLSGGNWGRPVGLESDSRGNLYLTLDDGSPSVLFITRDQSMGVDNGSSNNAPAPGFSDVYPNPTSNVAVVRFTLPEASPLTLTLLDMNGRAVRTVAKDRHTEAGEGSIDFSTADLPAGVYLYRLTAGGVSETGRVVVVR